MDDRISFFPADHAPASSADAAAVDEFVRALPRRLGHRDATVTPTGRAAMSMLFAHLGLGREDEVFVATTFDYPTVSSCVTSTIFNVSKPSRVLTDRTRAVFVIHEFGVPHPDTPAFKAEAERRGIPLVEDCAHTIDSRAATGWTVGGHGDWVIVSFPKVFATAAGGMLVGPPVGEPVLGVAAAETACATERAAAEWPTWPAHAARRRTVFRGLTQRFAGLDLRPVFEASDGITPWFFPVPVSNPDELLRAVRAGGIDCGRWHGTDILVFPCHQFLDDSHLDRIADAVSCAVRGRGAR